MRRGRPPQLIHDIELVWRVRSARAGESLSNMQACRRVWLSVPGFRRSNEFPLAGALRLRKRFERINRAFPERKVRVHRTVMGLPIEQEEPVSLAVAILTWEPVKNFW